MDANLFQFFKDSVSISIIVFVEEHEGIVFLLQNVLQHGKIDL